MGWVKNWNWLDSKTPRVVEKEATFGCAPVTSGVPRDSVLGLVLFSVCLNTPDTGVECTINNFAEDTELGDVVFSLSTDKRPCRGI